MIASSYAFEIAVLDAKELPRLHVVENMQVWIFDAGTATLASIYTGANLSVAKANPISPTVFAVDKGIQFHCDQQSVDICIVSAGYGGAWLKAVTPAKKQVQVNSDDPFMRYVVGQTVKNALTDTGLDLPANFSIEDVLVECITNVASGTIDWGFENSVESGDLDGLVDGASLAVAGFFRPTSVVTTGDNTKYHASTTRGALLCDFQAGSDVDQDEGVSREMPYKTDGTIKSIVYTASDHATTSRLHIFGQHLR